MFLTGFDAPTLNTLWVDKNLSEHTLIQAFSRTNKCFGETKKFGNIFSFRDIRENFDQALKMYADKRGLKDIKSNMVMREFEEVFEKFKDWTEKIKQKYPNPDEILNLEKEEKWDFSDLFGEFLGDYRTVKSYHEFDKDNPYLPSDEFNKYFAAFSQIQEEIRKEKAEKKALEVQEEDLSNEVRKEPQIFSWEYGEGIQANLDYIFHLIKDLYNCDNEQDRQKVLDKIKTAIRTNPEIQVNEDILNEFIEDLGKSFEKEKLEEVWKTEGKLRECLKDFCKKKEESNKKKIINDFLVKGVFLVEWVADKQLNTAKKKGEYSPSWSDTEKLIWKEKSTNLPTMTEKDEDGNFKWRKLITDISEAFKNHFERFIRFVEIR